MRRWYGIRHLRYWYLAWRFRRWWFTVGQEHWLVPNERDLEYLRQVWRGAA